MTRPVLMLVLQMGAGFQQSVPSALCVRVDSGHQEVVVTAGPVHVTAARAMDQMGGDDQAHDNVSVGEFAWPVTAWLRGYQMRLVDQAGHLLPRRWVHHLYLVDFDRRELVYPIAQHLLGVGEETPDFRLGTTVGIPVPAGHRMGLYVMWNNDSGADVDGVTLELVIQWNAAAPPRQLLQVFPFFVNASVALGSDWTFAIPPGGGSASYEFTLPISGRLRMAGGHLHDHGLALRLEDAVTNTSLLTLSARRDSSGRLLGMPYRVLTVHDSGLHLDAGRRYRVVATYENRTPQEIRAAMGVLAGVFAPDHSEPWPQVDRDDPMYVLDRRVLTTGRIIGVTTPVCRPRGR